MERRKAKQSSGHSHYHSAVHTTPEWIGSAEKVPTWGFNRISRRTEKVLNSIPVCDHKREAPNTALQDFSHKFLNIPLSGNMSALSCFLSIRGKRKKIEIHFKLNASLSTSGNQLRALPSHIRLGRINFASAFSVNFAGELWWLLQVNDMKRERIFFSDFLKIDFLTKRKIPRNPVLNCSAKIPF